MVRRLLALPVGLALAPVQAGRRLAAALDDLAVVADRARGAPDVLDQARARVDLALLELREVILLLGVIHAAAPAVDATARSVRDVGAAIHDGGLDLLAAARALH